MIDYRSKQSGSSRIRSTPVTELRRFFEYARPNSSSNEDMSSNFLAMGQNVVEARIIFTLRQPLG